MNKKQNFLDKNRIPIIVFLVIVIISSWVYLFLENKNSAGAENDHKLKILEAKVNDLENSETQEIVIEEDQKTIIQTSKSSISELINLNTADSALLETLPGIGPSKAGDIIYYRETNGGFKNISEIQNVKGIGPATHEKISNMITVE